MHNSTLYLAQILGPMFFIIGLGMLLNPSFYVKVMKGLEKEPFTLFLSTLIMIPVGMIMIMAHFFWNTLAEILISIIGLALVIKGALFALVPKAFQGLIDSILTPKLILFGGIVWTIGGGYLVWFGFMS